MTTDRELKAFADSLAEKIYGEPRLDQTDCAKLIYEALVTRPEGGVREALEAAKRFIENGVEFGYIQMPESGDPALDTLPKIKQALSLLPQQEGKGL